MGKSYQIPARTLKDSQQALINSKLQENLCNGIVWYKKSFLKRRLVNNQNIIKLKRPT
jgi:hypothetical protein